MNKDEKLAEKIVFYSDKYGTVTKEFIALLDELFAEINACIDCKKQSNDVITCTYHENLQKHSSLKMIETHKEVYTKIAEYFPMISYIGALINK